MRTETCIDIGRAKDLFQFSEGRFSGAMARRNAIDLPLVMQDVGEALDLRVGSFHQVEATEQHEDVRTPGRSCGENLFNTWMRTSDNQNLSKRSIYRQGELTEFQSTCHLGNCRDKEN